MRKLMITLGVGGAVLVGAATTFGAEQLGGPGANDGPRVGEPGRGRPGIGGPRRPGRPFVGGGRGVVRRLDLTVEQRTKVREVLEKARLDTGPLRKQLHDKRQAARQAAGAGALPDNVRAEVQAATADLRKQLMAARQKTRADLRAILTPEQAAELPAARR